MRWREERRFPIVEMPIDRTPSLQLCPRASITGTPLDRRRTRLRRFPQHNPFVVVRGDRRRRCGRETGRRYALIRRAYHLFTTVDGLLVLVHLVVAIHLDVNRGLRTVRGSKGFRSFVIAVHETVAGVVVPVAFGPQKTAIARPSVRIGSG